MAATATANTDPNRRTAVGFRSVRSFGTVALSGNYTTGGDALTIPKPGTTKAPYYVEFRSANGNTFGWDAANQKIKAFSAPGTELAAGAYPAGYTGDTITYEAEFPKLG